MSYVDGFIVAVPKDKLDAYKRMAELGANLWMEHGALEYRECVEDDVKPGKLTSFPQSVMLQEGEVVVFSWITHASREARDQTNAKVMADPRLKEFEKDMPFDGKRMIYGGFKTIVSR